MSQALIQTKKRMKSVKSTSKITKSMKLVSTAKLKTYLSLMESYKVYSTKLNEIVAFAFKNVEKIDNPLFSFGKGNKTLYVIITSSLGLCGSYNHNLFSYVEKNILNSDCLILGSKGKTHFKKSSLNNIKDLDYMGIKDDCGISALKEAIISSFLSGEYRDVKIVYTEYINSIKCKVNSKILLPIGKDIDLKSTTNYPPFFEPSIEGFINRVAPQYLDSLLYSYLLESEVSEQSERRNAMENATNNALDLVERLQLEYNKARQSAITQEIIEVSSASNNIDK